VEIDGNHTNLAIKQHGGTKGNSNDLQLQIALGDSTSLA